MEPSVYSTSVRDKMILVALILFGIFAFVTIWVNKELAAVMVGIVGSIVAGLFGVYKGNPATPDVQTQTTTSETKVETQAGTEPTTPVAK
jgi:hypothetical protein